MIFRNESLYQRSFGKDASKRCVSTGIYGVIALPNANAPKTMSDTARKRQDLSIVGVSSLCMANTVPSESTGGSLPTGRACRCTAAKKLV